MLRVAGLGQDAGAEVAGGEAQHLDVDVRQVGFRCLDVIGDLVLFEGGVDGHRARLGRVGDEGEGRARQKKAPFRELRHHHVSLRVALPSYQAGAGWWGAVCISVDICKLVFLRPA